MGMTMQAKARVVIRQSESRAPGTVVAIIDDAQNIGCSTYFNSPGEFHMTLPITHPQLGKCEPWRSHYAVEENVNGNWVQRYEGILSDFDANQDDVIVYGIDYFALLGRVVDTRYVQGEPERSATATPPGSKYVSQYISTVINHLLQYARDKSGSPVSFISIGKRDTFAEKITIYTTFVGIAEMIEGLVDSHRQGTGKRSRFWCQRYAANSYRWRLADNPGVDRPNLRMEYGGLVQGFQVIGFGEWSSKAHAIGRTQTGYELFYQSATAPGIDFSANGYPVIETAEVYDNVADKNDLQRRVKQRAMSSSRVGKRIALGLRTEHMSPFDGYDIADNIPVAIKRGSIDTTRWGTGYWSIYGVEWRVSQDGSAETTLVVSPKEQVAAFNADTLVDNEALPAPIETVRIADGAIDTSKLADGAVTTPILADAAVDDVKLADEAVTTPKFDDFAKAPLAGLADTADLAIEVENATSEVIVDATGLTVLNGKISLQDYSGQSVLTPAGFDGAWVDYLVNGVYNGAFHAGITNWIVEGSSGYGDTLAVATMVGTAEGEADYLASLSAEVPMWVLSAAVGLEAMVAVAADGRYLMVERLPNGLGGTAEGGEMHFLQDVPVVAGRVYDVSYHIDADIVAVFGESATFQITADWVDSDHNILSAANPGTLHTHNTLVAIDDLKSLFEAGEAPVLAKYLRVRLHFIMSDSTSGNGGYLRLFRVGVKPQERVMRLEIGKFDTVGATGIPHVIDTDGNDLWIRGGHGVHIENIGIAATGTPALVVEEGDIAVENGDFTDGAGNPAPRLMGAYSSESAGNQGGITTYTNITGASLTFTAVAGRKYLIYAEVFLLTSVATDRIGLEIHDGAGQLQSDRRVPGTTTAVKMICSVFYEGSGSKTIVLKAGRTTGTGAVTVVQGPTNPTTFHVLDVGPA